MRLTDTAIHRAKPRSKPYKMFDSEGLFLLVTPKGSKWWRFKYRFNNKENLLSLGVYPSGIPSYIGIKDSRTSKIFPKRIGAE
jgi:hypothetical protein